MVGLRIVTATIAIHNYAPYNQFIRVYTDERIVFFRNRLNLPSEKKWIFLKGKRYEIKKIFNK